MIRWILSAVIVAGYVFRWPEAVRDLVSGGFVDGVRLDYPSSYLPLAPFFHLADHVTFLSLRQHIAFLAAANLLWILFSAKKSFMAELFKFLGFNLAYAAVFAAIVLAPRPMARLEVNDPDILIYDAHSHTRHSWDANKFFTPEKNLLWHKKAGFHAAFITDHNRVDGVQEALAHFARYKSGAVPLRGEELSLHNCHLAVLGNAGLIANASYDGSVEGIQKFLTVVKSSRAHVIASLPEYWKHHWERREDFVKWGIRGFEIINSAPLALDFPPSLRTEMIDFCKKNRLVMTGITDNHGWGNAVYVWNVARIPGWRALSREGLEAALLEHLKTKKDAANHVMVRLKADSPEDRLHLFADPFLQIWELARTLPAAHAASTIFWIWVPWLIFRKKK